MIVEGDYFPVHAYLQSFLGVLVVLSDCLRHGGCPFRMVFLCLPL